MRSMSSSGAGHTQETARICKIIPCVNIYDVKVRKNDSKNTEKSKSAKGYQHEGFPSGPPPQY